MHAYAPVVAFYCSCAAHNQESLCFPACWCCFCCTKQDATETDTEYWLRVDLPGFSAEEVDVELQGDRLSITANKAESDAGKVGALHCLS